jgi:hypothetical protein
MQGPLATDCADYTVFSDTDEAGGQKTDSGLTDFQFAIADY